MKPLAACVLYTFVDSAYLRARDPISVAEQLCLGGADLIQLRGKDWSVEHLDAVAREIVKVTRAFGVRLVINDHLSVARHVGADMCHLGQEDFFNSGYKHVSQLEGSGVQPAIGLSTHAPEQAQRALAAAPAYIAIGPVFATPTKPTTRAVTLDYVRWAAANVQIPWFAIGGINLDNVHEVIAAGAKRICVVSAILKQNDIVSACREFKRALEVPQS